MSVESVCLSAIFDVLIFDSTAIRHACHDGNRKITAQTNAIIWTRKTT